MCCCYPWLASFILLLVFGLVFTRGPTAVNRDGQNLIVFPHSPSFVHCKNFWDWKCLEFSFCLLFFDLECCEGWSHWTRFVLSWNGDCSFLASSLALYLWLKALTFLCSYLYVPLDNKCLSPPCSVIYVIEPKIILIQTLSFSPRRIH